MKCFKYILIFLCFIFCSSVIAANKLYKTNLIVFSHVTDWTLRSELWPNILKRPYLKNAYVLIAKTPDLQKEAALLNKQRGYKVILHTSWVQNIGSLHNAKWIHIYAGQAYNAKGEPIKPGDIQKPIKPIKKTKTQNAKNQNDKKQVIQPDESRIPVYWELNGKIKLSKVKFFDIYTNLYLTIPTSKPNNNIPLRTFILQQHRRAKIDQLNYIDHPLFGVLIKISKFKEKPKKTIIPVKTGNQK